MPEPLPPPLQIVWSGFLVRRTLTKAEAEAYHLHEAAKNVGKPEQAFHLEEALRNREWAKKGY